MLRLNRLDRIVKHEDAAPDAGVEVRVESPRRHYRCNRAKIRAPQAITLVAYAGASAALSARFDDALDRCAHGGQSVLIPCGKGDHE